MTKPPRDEAPTRPVSEPARTAGERAVAISIGAVSQRFGDADAPGSVLALADISLESRAASSSACSVRRAAARARCSTSSAACSSRHPAPSPSAGARSTARRFPPKSPSSSRKHRFPWYTIIENFHVALKFQDIAKAEWDERALATLSAVGMASFAGHYPTQLSVGMRQRVDLARGSASGPTSC